MSPEEADVCKWVAFGIATVSLLCSLFTLMLIKRVGQWNGYHMIIFSLTLAQILYDINYMLGVLPGSAACNAWQFLDVVGGLSTTLWSNVLGGCVLHVAIRIKSANIEKRYPLFFVLAALFPLCVALLQVILGVITFDKDDDSCEYAGSTEGFIARGLYYWTRILSIVVNVIIYISITVKINRMTDTWNGKKYDALTELAARMKYYPLFQALSRSGAAWDEFNRAGDSGYFPSSLMRSICSPSSGIWYFMIFVLMQPGMREHVMQVVKGMLCCCFACKEDVADSSSGQHNDMALRANALSSSARVSLKGSMIDSDGHKRSLFRSGDGSLVLDKGDLDDEIFGGESIDRIYSNLNELDEDDLESIITTGVHSERTLSRQRSRSLSKSNTKN